MVVWFAAVQSNTVPARRGGWRVSEYAGCCSRGEVRMTSLASCDCTVRDITEQYLSNVAICPMIHADDANDDIT